MSHGLSCFWAGILCLPGQSGMDAEQFRRVMTAEWVRYQDVYLVYEGSQKFVGPDDLALSSGLLHGYAQDFQGMYAYRSDGNAWMDVYDRTAGDPPSLYRSTFARVGDELQEVHWNPNERRDEASRKPRTSFAYPGVLDRENSPEWIFKGYLFQHLPDLTPYQFAWKGWQTIEGHRCAVAEWNAQPRPRLATDHYVRYWIDMDRGGHIVKMERYEGGNLYWRTEIELEQVTAADGSTAWFPRHGTMHSFKWKDRFYSQPILEGVWTIVGGSVRLNEGLPDRVFSVHWDGNLGTRPTPTLPLREEIAKAPRQKVRTDPKGVQEHLNKALERAEGRIPGLVAETTPWDGWDWWRTGQIALGALGVAGLGTAALLTIRGRARRP